MTAVRCLLKECRDWLNGMCSRRTLKVIGTRCTDFTRRRSQFKNVTTTVECDQKDCMANRGSICVRDQLLMKGDGCDWETSVTEK